MRACECGRYAKGTNVFLHSKELSICSIDLLISAHTGSVARVQPFAVVSQGAEALPFVHVLDTADTRDDIMRAVGGDFGCSVGEAVHAAV